MTTDVLRKHVEDWSETFFGIIPEDGLHAAYMAAKRNPERRPEDARFPVKDTEVLQAWYKLAAKESVVPANENECDFCRLVEQSPAGRYKPCPFHNGDSADVFTANHGRNEKSAMDLP